MHSRYKYKRFKFSGFGGVVSGFLYQLTITIGKYHYIDMPFINVVYSGANEPEYDLILPATAFQEFDYEIKNSNKQIILKPHSSLQIAYNIILKDSNDKLIVLECSVSNDTTSVMSDELPDIE